MSSFHKTLSVYRVSNNTRQRLEVVLLDSIFAGENECGSSVVDTRSIAGSDHTILLEDWVQSGEAFVRSVGLRVLVHFKRHLLAFNLDHHWHNLILKLASLVGGIPSLLREQGKLVAFLSCYIVLDCQIFGRDRHRSVAIPIG